ncbi:MAG: GNAT family N-acetyltransferase [Pyrinomonadaceae bacterium]
MIPGEFSQLNIRPALNHDLKMYFVPSVRSRGLGRYILQRTIDRARELGFKRMVLETSSRLEAANHLYSRFGFQPVSSDHLASRADKAYALDL